MVKNDDIILRNCILFGEGKLLKSNPRRYLRSGHVAQHVELLEELNGVGFWIVDRTFHLKISKEAERLIRDRCLSSFTPLSSLWNNFSSQACFHLIFSCSLAYPLFLFFLP